MSGIINKVKEALHSDKHDSTTTHNTHSATHNNGVPEGTAGPHSSKAANAADPRVDSDLDSSRHAGQTGHGIGGTTHSQTGAGYGSTGTTTGAGPHNSSMLNKVDPRVDSDRDGSHNAGAATGQTGASAYTSGVGATSHNNGAGYGTGSHAHNSGIANKLDPTVNTGSSTGGYSGTHVGNNSGTHTGTTGGISHSTNAGPHNSNLMNKVDPTVDSDLDGRGNRHGASTGGVFGASGSHATAGSGTAQNTAGPHNSDMLNKVDPRVDSDRDGSKTFAGNKTHA